MPPEQVIAYLAAYRAFAAATRRAEELAARVAAACEALKDWRRAADDPIARGGPGFVPNTLPDGRTVREALDAWVAARGELADAWRCVPQDERQGLMPPPGQE